MLEISMREEIKKENEKKKIFLRSYITAKKELKRLRLEKTEVRLNKLMPSAINDGMPHGSGISDLSSYAVELDEIDREINKARYKCIKAMKMVRNTINELEDTTEKRLLTLRYIKGKQWEEIAVEMGYSYRHTTKLHGIALSHVKIKDDLECPIGAMI